MNNLFILKSICFPILRHLILDISRVWSPERTLFPPDALAHKLACKHAASHNLPMIAIPRLDTITDIRNQRNIPIFLKEEFINQRLAARRFSPDNIPELRRVDIIANQKQFWNIPARLWTKDSMTDFLAELGDVGVQRAQLLPVDLQDKPQTVRLEGTPSHLDR